MTWRDFVTVKWFIALVLLLLIITFSRQLATVMFPFITGLIFAALLEPIISVLEKRIRLPRPAAVMGTLLVSVSVLSYLLIVLATKAISELISLASMLPQYRVAITEVTNELFSQYERFNESLPTQVSNSIQESVVQFFGTIEALTKGLVDRLLATLTGFPIFMAITLVVIVATYFISKDKNLLIDFFMRLVPDRWKQRIDTTKHHVAIDLMGFLKARLLLLVIATMIAAVGLMLINTRYWLILAIVIGVLDNIPVVGPGIIFTPWVAMTFLIGDTDRAVFLAVLYVVIFSVHQLTEPKIMGDSVGIHPLAMLVALYGGIVFFGVIGIFIGPILLIILKAAIHSGLFRPVNFPE